MTERRVPFNHVEAVGRELGYIEDSISRADIGTHGEYTRRCSQQLEQLVPTKRALITHSCTAALEMAAILAGLESGDEVIMPSFAFVSTANSVALRGGVPVFVDIREDTLNLDERLVPDAIGERTKAIVAVHYAGVACELSTLADIAARHDLLLLEDAAQGVLASYQDRPLGTFGALGAFSFHETKNVTSGKGGALLVNDEQLLGRAETVYAQGTDQLRFLRGEVGKYAWQDLGSAFAIPELNAAFLSAQLEQAREVTDQRLAIWAQYDELLEPLERSERARRPIVPEGCRHNGHMYYLLLPQPAGRGPFIASLREAGVEAVFHYIPLHDSVGGRRFGRTVGNLVRTTDLAARIVRLPLWPGMTPDDVDMVVAAVHAALR